MQIGVGWGACFFSPAPGGRRRPRKQGAAENAGAGNIDVGSPPDRPESKSLLRRLPAQIQFRSGAHRTCLRHCPCCTCLDPPMLMGMLQHSATSRPTMATSIPLLFAAASRHKASRRCHRLLACLRTRIYLDNAPVTPPIALCGWRIAEVSKDASTCFQCPRTGPPVPPGGIAGGSAGWSLGGQYDRGTYHCAS